MHKFEQFPSPYTPPEEEVKKAEEIMTDEQKEASETRAKFAVQERDPFDDFMEHIDQNDERRPPTQEEKERMDDSLIQLGKIFEGSDVRWHLDGAMNISLMKGEYIGIHKDTDVSIELNELEELDGHLERKGYGLFLSYPKNPEQPDSKKIMKRVGASNFKETPTEHPMIVAIDEQSKIREGGHLNFIDTHIVKRDENNSPVGWGEVALPKKWFEGQPIDFQSQEINISHPAKVAYFKLHGTRSYDRTDLKVLAETGKVSMEDVNEIEETFEKEFNSRKQGAEKLLKEVSNKIQSDMSADQIFEIFAKEPLVADKIQYLKESLNKLAKAIEASPDKSFEQIKKIAFETLNIDESFDEQRKKIEELRQWVNDVQEK